MEATNKNQHDNGNDNTNPEPPSFGVMPRPSTTAVKSESNYNPQTTNTNTNTTIPTATNKKKKKKKKKRKINPTAHATAAVTVPSFGVVSPTATAVAADVPSSSFSLFPGPDHVVSSSCTTTGNSNTNNTNHDSINILAELKKIEERQTQRQVTMQKELLDSYQTHADTTRKEFQKLQEVMTAKISSLEQHVAVLLQRQPQQPQPQEGISGINDNDSTNNNRTNSESETGYDDGDDDDDSEEDDNDNDNDSDNGDNNDNDGDKNVHAHEENGAEIENNNEIIDISSSSSNNGDDDDDDDDWIENDGEEYNVDDEECSDGNESLQRTTHTAAATAAPGAAVFHDEDTNHSLFKGWKRKYDILQKYVNSNSGSIPFKSYKNEQDRFLLGAWVDNQKTAYRSILSGRHSNNIRMTKPRVEYLKQIPNWTWGNSLEVAEFADDNVTRHDNRVLLEEEDTKSQWFKIWNCRYKVLKKYVKSNNGQLPILRYKNKRDGFQLGWWVQTQKSGYWNEIKGRVRKNGVRMTKLRAEWLESIPNWTWGACYVGGTQEQRDSTNDRNKNDDAVDELDDDVIVTKIVTPKCKVSRKRCSQDDDDDTDSDCSSSSTSDENTACRKGKKKTKKMKHRKKKKENKERESERRRRYYVWNDNNHDDNNDTDSASRN